MNSNHFERHISRLIETYGKGAYPKVRSQLLWNEVQNLSDEWFTYIVDDFIASYRQAPLITDFREKISLERERLYKIEKNKYAQEAQEFVSVYTGDDIRMICETIRKRVGGQISDEDWKCHLTLLDSVPTTTPRSEKKEMGTFARIAEKD